MSKIITITGNGSSGKSLLSCLLAEELSKNNEVILINYSSMVPMHPVWQPLQKVDKSQSLGNILSAPSINIAMLGEAVVSVKKNYNIGLLGYVAGDTPLTYIDATYQKGIELIKTVCNLTNGYIIFDCGCEFNDVLRPSALEMADVVLMSLTADLRGLHYYNSQKALLQNSLAFQFEKTLCIASNTKSYFPVSDMSTQLDRPFWGQLEYCQDLEKASLQGMMFDSYKFCSPGNKKMLKNMIEVISGE